MPICHQWFFLEKKERGRCGGRTKGITAGHYKGEGRNKKFCGNFSKKQIDRKKIRKEKERRKRWFKSCVYCRIKDKRKKNPTKKNFSIHFLFSLNAGVYFRKKKISRGS